MLMMNRDTVAIVQSPVWELANQVVEKHVCCRENLRFAHFQANLKSLFCFHAKIFCHVYLITKVRLKVIPTRHLVFQHSMRPFPSEFVFWIHITWNSCNMFHFQGCPFQLFKLLTHHFLNSGWCYTGVFLIGGEYEKEGDWYETHIRSPDHCEIAKRKVENMISWVSVHIWIAEDSPLPTSLWYCKKESGKCPSE